MVGNVNTMGVARPAMAMRCPATETPIDSTALVGTSDVFSTFDDAFDDDPLFENTERGSASNAVVGKGCA